MRHPALPVGEKYGFEIPGHKNLDDQSVNSEKINTPDGEPGDVLYDTVNGGKHAGCQIACFDANLISGYSLPNKNTVRYDRHGNVIRDADIYQFEVRHDPTPCMYPHCYIQAKKNGVAVSGVSNGVKSAIRSQFATWAERNRLEMLPHSSTPGS